jgi:hypothetical protein
MDQLQKLYDVLVRDGYYTKSFEDFQTQFNNEEYQDKVFGVVSRDGLFTKDINEFKTKYTGKQQGVATDDATVTPTDTESASENILSGLPKVTADEVKLTEEDAIVKLRQRFKGLGFEFKEARPGFDFITIKGPAFIDENGVETRNEQTFSFDRDFFGLSAGGAEEGASKINDFIKQEAERKGEDLDLGVYSYAMKQIDNPRTSFKDESGNQKQLKDLTSEELIEHRNIVANNLFSSDDFWKNIDLDIKDDLNSFIEGKVKELKVKYDTSTDAGVDAANMELERLAREEQARLLEQSPVYQKAIKTVSSAITSKFGDESIPGSMINEKLALEGEQKLLPFTSAIRKVPLVGDMLADVSRGVNIGFRQILKGDVEYRNIIAPTVQFNEDKSELERLELQLKNGEIKADQIIKGDSRTSVKDNVTTYGFEGTVTERVELLKNRKKQNLGTVAEGIADAEEYQEIIQKLEPAKVFDKSILDPHVTTDEFQRMLGTQGAQMLAGIFIYPTFAQESGGIATESLLIEAARDKFKDQEDEQAMKSFMLLSGEQKSEAMLNVIEKGQVDFTPALVNGGAAAGLDLVSNFFVIAKAKKFIPKNVWRDLLRGNFGKILKSEGTKALLNSTAIETVTEGLQEALGVRGVQQMTGYLPNREDQLKRVLEGSAQALITTPVLQTSGRVAATGVNEIKALALKDPRATRKLINEQKAAFDKALEDDGISQEERDNAFTELEAVEEIINNTKKYGKMDADSKSRTIDALYKVNQIKKQQQKILNEAQNEEASTPGAPSIQKLQADVKANKLNEDLKKEQDNIIKELLVSNYFQDGELAAFINETKEGDLAGKNFKRFKDKKEARKYFAEKFKDENWIETTKKYMKTFQETVLNDIFMNGTKPEQAELNALKAFDKKLGTGVFQNMADAFRLHENSVNASVQGNTAWVIDENIVENIRKGDITSTNAFHHEALHMIQANMSTPELKSLTESIIAELESATDPKLKQVFNLSKKLFEQRYGKKYDKRNKAYYLEFFANLSDAFKYYSATDLNESGETMFNIGSIFGKAFGKNMGAVVDFSKMDAGNALQMIQKFNKFRGESGFRYSFRLPRGKVTVDQDENLRLKSEKAIYDDLTQTFEDYVDLNREVAANVTSDMMQGIVFNKLISLKNANLIQGFSDAQIEEIMMQFTGPRKNLPDKLKNRGAVGLLMKYDKGFGGGVMGYFNATIRGRKMIDMRLQEFVENHPRFGSFEVSMQEEGVTTAVESQQESLSPEEIMIQEEERQAERAGRVERSKQKILLHEQTNKMGVPGLEKAFNVAKKQLTDDQKEVMLKDLKKQYPETYVEVFNAVSEMFGVKPKAKVKNGKVIVANYTQEDVQNSQQIMRKLGSDFFKNFVFFNQYTEGVAKLDNNGEAIIKDGKVVIDPTTQYLATGVPAVLQSQRQTQANDVKEVVDLFYETIMKKAEKGPKKGQMVPSRPKNLVIQRLKNFDSDFFFEAMGTVRGQLRQKAKETNISQKHIGIHHLMTTAVMSQGKRQNITRGRSFDRLADGLPKTLASEKIRALDNDTFIDLHLALPEIGTIIAPHANDYSKKILRKAIETALPQFKGRKIKYNGKDVVLITHIVDGMHPILANYTDQVERFEVLKINPEKFETFVLNEAFYEQKVLMQMFDARVDGKRVKEIEALWDSEQNVQATRDAVTVVIEKLFETSKSPKEAIELFVKYHLPLLSGSGKIAGGQFKVDDNGRIFRSGEKGKNRRHAFIGIEDIVNNALNKAFGGQRLSVGVTASGRLDLKNVFFDGKKIENIDRSLLDQSSEAFIKKIKDLGEVEIKKQSEIESKEAMNFIHDIMELYRDTEFLDGAAAVMMLNGLNSSMRSPMRRAANLAYVTDGYDAVKNPSEDLEYEHMIPAAWMMAEHASAVWGNKLNKNGLAEFYKDYTVAIIPKDMDLTIKAVGYNSTMPVSYKLNDGAYLRYYNNRTLGRENIVAIRELGTDNYIGKIDEAISKGERFVKTKNLYEVLEKSRSLKSEKTVGMSAFDFDETLIDEGENFIIATKGEDTVKISSGQWPIQGPKLAEEGYSFDFKDFVNVRGGVAGPLLQKLKNRIEKYGIENNYILTARPPESATAIHEWLKTQGINMPIENITGLGNSTGEAKALWIANKFSEGYNDIYFVDDALPNVEAVADMINQLDIKGKSVQALRLNSEKLNKEFNDILEDVTKIESKKRFSQTKARKRGAKKGRFRLFIPPSHEDFVGLLYNFMGKGEVGNQHRQFFEDNLVRPLNRAYRELNAAKQAIANDYKQLIKNSGDIKKKLRSKLPDGDFTYEDAVRVYLWDKHDLDIPGISPTDQNKLVEAVTMDQKLRMFAEVLNFISRQEEYVAPYDGWEGGSIKTDLNEAMGETGRKKYFAQYLENAEVIFSEENLNKIEAAYGPRFREALEDVLYRISTGRNRPQGQGKMLSQFMNWLNGSVASVMFLNMRSALLQQMSIVNFINFADNNIYAAAKAFANQKQYWTDWATIFNSDFLKERRKGIGTDINGNDLARSLQDSRNPMAKLLQMLLRAGFTPTQVADNIAIATGGSTFYRNRINTYLKDGLSQKEAESRAFEDFQEIAEETQQSAREDKVSMQQASWVGKIILNFQNVTSQYNRIAKRSFLDLKNRRISKGYKDQRTSDLANISRIAYYLAVQNLIFYGLQSAIFAAMFDDEEEGLSEEEKQKRKKVLDKKSERIINGTIDSILRGSGMFGAIISVLKNMAIKFEDERNKDYNHDESAVLMEALNLSPVVGIKARKIVIAEKTMNYDKDLINYMNTWDIDNPAWQANFAYTEAITNAPLAKTHNKIQNVRDAIELETTMLNRILMFFGFSKYNLGVEENIEMQMLEKKAKEAKKSKKKKKKSKRLPEF